MIVEKYVANPAANSFNYVVLTISKKCVCRQFTAIASGDLEDCTFLIYRDEVTSWNVTNHEYALFARKWYAKWVAASMAEGFFTPGDNIFVELVPGTYTFAAYLVSDVANFKMAWHLEDQ